MSFIQSLVDVQCEACSLTKTSRMERGPVGCAQRTVEASLSYRPPGARGAPQPGAWIDRPPRYPTGPYSGSDARLTDKQCCCPGSSRRTSSMTLAVSMQS